ncbi:MAG: hypothetical protein U0800_09625 [Isosphaeraceae bacterium]
MDVGLSWCDPRRCIWVALALSALAMGGFNAWIGLDPDDSENLETTCVMAAARRTEGARGCSTAPYSAPTPAS